MEFIFSKHSLEQIELRGLSKKVIEDILLAPDYIIEDVEGVFIYQKLVFEHDKSYLYRVFVNRIKIPPMVVTAYKTSKTKKYEN
ncbi:MAG: hypothetical protein FD170_3565 [Bacteroidetes bacterium]|nr:MAG: hypothetical protein FD170_3565 [Bacteroidota bacterium]